VDVSLNEVTSTTPLRVSAIGKPTGGAWGSTYIDNSFKTDVVELLGPYSKHLSSATMLDMLREWEAGKTRAGPITDIRIRVAGLLKDISAGRGSEFTMDELKELASNLAEGRSMEDDPPLKPRGDFLEVRAHYLRATIMTKVDQIRNHVEGLLNPASSDYCGHSLDGLFLVGGFAASELLKEVRPAPPHVHRMAVSSSGPSSPSPPVRRRWRVSAERRIASQASPGPPTRVVW